MGYTCALCNRKTFRSGGKAAQAEDRKCKKCGILICPSCYKGNTKSDICPKCGGELYIPAF